MVLQWGPNPEELLACELQGSISDFGRACASGSVEVSRVLFNNLAPQGGSRGVPPTKKRLGQNLASPPSAQLIYVVACFVLHSLFCRCYLRLSVAFFLSLEAPLYYSYGIYVHEGEEA